jgi:TatD DNase family protein
VDRRELLEKDPLTCEDGVLFHSKKGKPLDIAGPYTPVADTHGHLTVFREHDPAVALARAALAGVRMLVVPLDPTEDAKIGPAMFAEMDRWVETAGEALSIYAELGLVPPDFGEAYAGAPGLLGNVKAVCGVHPYGAGVYTAETEKTLRAMLGHDRSVGVGEIGLDYTCDVDHDVQKDVFARQLAIANERGVPVCLHIRDAAGDAEARAHAEALEVLKEAGVPAAGVDLHCYTSDAAVMAPWIELGCHVAFGGAVTFNKSDDIRGAALACPATRLLTETDCPYMAPVPLRGMECEPAMAAVTARYLCDLRGEKLDDNPGELAGILWSNACDLFGA